MGNAKLCDPHLRVSRPGPQVRAAAAVQAEAKRVVLAEQARIRMARRRARVAKAAEAATREAPHGLEATTMTERSSSRISNKLALAINEELRSCPTAECRRMVVEKLLNHNTFWPMLPEYYARLQEAKSIFVFLESFKSELQSVKTANLKVFLAQKGALLDAAVSEGCDGARSLGRMLQVHPRNIHTAVSRRIGIDPGSQFQLLERSKREGISLYLKEKVLLWWDQQSRVSPNKNDITQKRIGRNDYVVHATHYLTETQTQLYLGFRDAHPECIIKQRVYKGLKPWYVKPLKDQNTCCCIYHVEMGMIKQGLIALRDLKRDIHSEFRCNCSCAVCSDDSLTCNAHSNVYDSLTQMWNACVCEKGELDKWHHLDCLMGHCMNCGVSKFNFCPYELSKSLDLKLWKCFEKLPFGVDEETGQENKRIQEVFKETSPGELVAYLKSKVGAFVTHNFVANWQDGECRRMMENVPVGAMISHIDFAENYAFAIQNEDLDPLNTAYTATVAKAMHFVARYPGLTGCTMRWNYFGSGHGKGEWNGAGAVVKDPYNAPYSIPRG